MRYGIRKPYSVAKKELDPFLKYQRYLRVIGKLQTHEHANSSSRTLSRLPVSWLDQSPFDAIVHQKKV